MWAHMSAPTVVHVTLEMCASGFVIVGKAGEAMAAKKLIRVSTVVVLLPESIESRCLGLSCSSILGRTRACKGRS